MNRRQWLKTAAVAGGTLLAGAAAGPAAPAAPSAAPTAADLAKKLPRWRGFNLLEKFNAGRNQPFVESDFEWMREWGFDFVRLPMDYRCWTAKDNPYKYDEAILKHIDQAVEFGRKHKVHVSVNLHRAPGYTVAKPPETLNLWTDEEARKQFDAQWTAFARRYQGRPPTEVSFNLVNEPDRNVDGPTYAKVCRRAAAAIRAVDPNRLILADGLEWGSKPCPDLVDSGIAQSTHGYQPHHLTHYEASWVNSKGWPVPTWPLKTKDQAYDRAYLAGCINMFKDLAARGVGVHVGEFGCYNRTPHGVVLAWMRDYLELWKEAGFGWAQWNFRGPFGFLDSGRSDVAYEDFHGHKLDRKMLELLRAF